MAVVTDTAAHPAVCVDDPSEPHIDDDGACLCLAPCCCDRDDNCVCTDCRGEIVGCYDHA